MTKMYRCMDLHPRVANCIHELKYSITLTYLANLKSAFEEWIRLGMLLGLSCTYIGLILCLLTTKHLDALILVYHKHVNSWKEFIH